MSKDTSIEGNIDPSDVDKTLADVDPTADPSEFLSIDDSEIDPDTLLKIVQKKRLYAILNGQELSKADMKILADAAKTSVDMRRIQVEENGNESVRELARAIAENVHRPGSTNPYLKDVTDQGSDKTVETPKLDDKLLEEFEINDSELSTTMSETTYKDMFDEE